MTNINIISKLQCNNSMKQLLKQYVKNSREESLYKVDVVHLSKLMLSDIIEYEGCYLWNSAVDWKGLKRRNDYTDKIGIELLENHIHVKDIIRQRVVKEEDMLCVGLVLVEYLMHKLTACFPKERFIITIACAITGRKELRDCVVRFYKERIDNAPGISDDLEGYESEAVGKIVVGI